MSKGKGGLLPFSKTKAASEEQFHGEGWGNALLVQEGYSGNLVGKILTIIESLGLPEKQEQAFKDVVRNEIYDSFDNVWIIGEEDHTILREKAFRFGQFSIGGNLPPNFPTGAVVGRYSVGNLVTPQPRA